LSKIAFIQSEIGRFLKDFSVGAKKIVM